MIPLWLGSTKKVIFTNTVFQIVGRLIGAFTTFCVSFVIARAYGTDGFGDFIKVISYVSLYYLVVDFGINAVFLKRDSAHQAWQSFFGLRLVLGCIATLLCLAVLVFVPSGETQGFTPLVKFSIIIFSLSIVFQGLITTANALFQKHFSYWRASIAVFVGSAVELLTLLSVVVLFRESVSLPFLTITVLLASVATAVVSLLFVKQLSYPLSPLFSLKDFFSFFTASVPLGLSLLFNVVYFRIDMFFLSSFRSTHEVGIYGFAYKLFEFLLVLPTFYMNAVYPLLLAQKQIEKPTPRFTQLISKSIVFLLGGSVFVTVIMWFSAPLFSLVRPEFIESAVPLRILLLGLPFFFVSSVMMWGLIALDKQRLLVLVYGLFMVANILLNALFIPRYGYVAASWITVASEAVVVGITGSILYSLLKKHR